MKYIITFIIVAGIGVFLLNYFQSVGQPEKKPMKQMKEVFVDPTDYKKLSEKNKKRIQEFNKKLNEKENNDNTSIDPIIKKDTEELIKDLTTNDNKKVEVNQENNNQNNQLSTKDFIVLEKKFLGKKHNILQIKYKINKKYINKDLKVLVTGNSFKKKFSIYPLDTENEDILGEVPSQNITSITLINQQKKQVNNDKLKTNSNSLEDIAEKNMNDTGNSIPTTENSSLNLDPTLKTILKEIGN